MVEFYINDRLVTAQKGDTILQAARKSGEYIPTLCYLSKVSPIESCRLCVVEVKGSDGFVLSCSTPVVEGIRVYTQSPDLQSHRNKIMQMYNVNHPLECGVCDKSGECDLQNKTLEMEVDTQEFATKDVHRPVEDWGFIQYDPSLCIMCEKCVSTCNEIVGEGSLGIKLGGYGSQIEFQGDDCSHCGECMSVCPVGALSASHFKYSTNAWELNKIPGICSHCSSGCELLYETKHAGTLTANNEQIYRVTNDFEHKSLCAAGRFGFDINSQDSKDPEKLEGIVQKFDQYKAVRFGSVITNEEAAILQQLKERSGYKLFNEEARLFGCFLDAYENAGGSRYWSATLDSVKNSDAISVFGTRINDDNPMVKFAINRAVKRNRARVAYLHPVEDEAMRELVTDWVRYEVGTEEGVTAMLLDALLGGREDLPNSLRAYLDDLDLGNISAESNVGEEELEALAAKMQRAQRRVLIAGSDLYNHPRAENIAAMLAILEKHGAADVLLVPPGTNTLGVANICDLDIDSGQDAVGYNAYGTCTIGVDGKLKTPSLLQQEGTLTTIDKMVKPTNAATGFGGYCLNDIAGKLGLKARHTIDYTALLPGDKGYKEVCFDTLMADYRPYSSEQNGYALQSGQKQADTIPQEVAQLPEYNGTVVYNCNDKTQMNRLSARSAILENADTLRGSEQFALAAKLKDGDEVCFVINGIKFSKVFRIDPDLKGVIALNPTAADGLSGDMLSSVYRFNKVNIKTESVCDE